MGRAGLAMLGRWGARLGLAWIILLLVLAVFAPLIANSHPIIMHTDAGWSSPLVRHLTPPDVTLFVAALAALLLLPIPPLRKFALRWRVLVGAVMITLAGILSMLLIHPPEVVVLSRYREMREAGQVRFMLNTPIPYSPTDRLNDSRLDPRLVSPGWHPNEIDIASAIVNKAESATGLIYEFNDQDTNTPSKDAANTGVNSDIDTTIDTDIQVGESLSIAEARKIAEQLFDRYLQDPDHYEQIVTDARHDIDRLKDTPLYTRFHLMGTTAYGEDLASRMIHASRIALAIGFIATGIAVVFGIIIGGLMGYFSGWVDLLGMRLVEVFSAIPQIFLLIAFVAFYGRNLYLIMTIIGLTGWVGYALFIRRSFSSFDNRIMSQPPAPVASRFVPSSSDICCPTASRPSSSMPVSVSPPPSLPNPRSVSSASASSKNQAGDRCSNRHAASAARSIGGSPPIRAWPSS